MIGNPAWPVEYDIVAPGQVYELDVVGITNPQAIVLSKNQGMITVQITEGNRSGEVLNVRPEDLLTSDESFKQEVENVEIGVGLTVLVICALTDCNKEDSEAIAPSSQPVGGRHVFLYNHCGEEISVWVAFHRTGRVVYTVEPYKIASEDGMYLKADGDFIVVDRLSLYTHVTTVWNGVVNDDGERVSIPGSVFEWETRELRVLGDDPDVAMLGISC